MAGGIIFSTTRRLPCLTARCGLATAKPPASNGAGPLKSEWEMRRARKMERGVASEQSGRAVTGQVRTHDKGGF
jgi:hypothetical protein